VMIEDSVGKRYILIILTSQIATGALIFVAMVNTCFCLCHIQIILEITTFTRRVMRRRE